jgi:hypothetical protein
MPPAALRGETPPVLARRNVTLAAAAGISAMMLPAMSSHASTVGSVEANEDSCHWFSVEPTLRAVDGVVTPFDPARSPYLFYSLTASSTQRLALAALEFNLRQAFTATEYTVDVRTSAGLRTIALSPTGSRDKPYDATLDTPDTSLATPVNYATYAHLAVFGRAIAVAG